MKEITIAFDIDGTLLNNEGIPPDTPVHLRPKRGVNIEAVLLLQILSRMKNSRIIIWSGGGTEYAKNICYIYGFEKYADIVVGKNEYDGHVDICFDDVHSCELADKNIIVRFK